MCSYYIIFAPEKLSIGKNPFVISRIPAKKRGHPPAKLAVLWYTERAAKAALIEYNGGTHGKPAFDSKKVFGYDGFRPGQEEIVSRLLAGQDVLAVMPTGAGKSICYQVPALLLPGITIVVSPLVSLMKDQVGALVQAGVAAAFLNNSLTDNQKALMLRRAREGWYKIIYVAPERLEMPGFQRFAQEREVRAVEAGRDLVGEAPRSAGTGAQGAGPCGHHLLQHHPAGGRDHPPAAEPNRMVRTSVPE